MATTWLTRWFTNKMRPLRRPVRTKIDRRQFGPTVEALDKRVMLSTTATFSAARLQLTITGDAQDNTIVVSRNAAGTILVNNGAVAIQGGSATVANTRLILISGGLGNDNLSLDQTNGALPSANIDGGAGNDTITGGRGNDMLSGGSGNDTYRFDTDNALGSDTINEESSGGTDTLDFSATTTRAVNIDLSNAPAPIVFSATTTRAVNIDPNTTAQVVNAGLTLTLSSGNTIENVIGGALGDDITGDSLNNVIEGRGGNDRLDGGAGNDTYRFDADNALGNDSIDEFDNAIDVNSGIDTLDFSATTTRAVNINLGIKGSQVVNAGLTVGFGFDAIENVIGGALGDTLRGNTLNNTIEGRGGNDTLIGGAGNDTYRFDTDNALGSDTINESGGGVDTLDFSATTTRAVKINLANATAQVVNAGLTLALSSGNTIENIIGGALGDTLTGNSLNNSLKGGSGNDTLNGAAGNDTLFGGLGLAVLNGGTGTNTLIQD